MIQTEDFRPEISKKEGNILMFLLLTLSGNPVVTTMVTEYRYVIVAIILFLIYSRKIFMSNRTAILVGQYFGFIAIIFICQTIIFRWNTFPGIINFYAKLICGITVYILLGENFKYVYLRVMTFIAAIDIFFWFMQVALGVEVGFPFFEGTKTVFLYTKHFRSPTQNCGFFWEPGAFACYLDITFILFFSKLKELFHLYRTETIIIFLALLTTQSTTGYVTFAAIIFTYILLKMKSRAKYILLPIFIIGASYAYTNLTFLSNKIGEQTERSLNADGEFSSDRLGSFLFDIQYISKHPIVGNGFHARTYWADHPELFEMMESGDLSFSGNGLGGLIRQLGFAFVFLFIYIWYRNNSGIRKSDLAMPLFFFAMLLFGEPLGNYPLFLGLPFFVISDKLYHYETNSSTINRT